MGSFNPTGTPGGIGLPGGYRCATGQKTKFQVEDLILFYYLKAPVPHRTGTVTLYNFIKYFFESF